MVNNSKNRLFDMMRKVNRLDENIFRNDDRINTINEFAEYVKNEINLDVIPEINYIDEEGAAAKMKSFAGYNPNTKAIILVISNRNLADILRSLAHEMVHHLQNIENRLNNRSGETGSEEENEANSKAGILMRNYGKINPKIFE